MTLITLKEEFDVDTKSIKEIPREFDFEGELIKHVVILNPSKEKEAMKRFFNSFPEVIGRPVEEEI